LVLLRTAIVATAASFSFWGAVGTFAYSVVVAVIFGAVVGWLNLQVRKRVTDPTVNTVISFAVPFAAAIPAEMLGASGLVAAVVAGLVTGIRAPRVLSPQNRLSDSQNWRTVELVLEGAVFLTMGVQIRSIVMNVEKDHGGVWLAVLIAVGALLLTIVVRAAYVAPLLGILSRRGARTVQMRERMQGVQERLDTPEGTKEAYGEFTTRKRASDRDLSRFAFRVTQAIADIDYFLRQPLGWRDGTIVVWAGMRGAVTVAAAQTLPDDTPQRSVIVLIAFAVAALSLLIQGGTIGPLLRRLAPVRDDGAADVARTEERARLMQLLRSSAESIPQPPQHDGPPTPADFTVAKKHRLDVIAAQRAELLDARDHGTFDADLLAGELANLDATEIAIDMRGRSAG